MGRWSATRPLRGHGAPQALGTLSTYDVTPNGERVVMIQADEGAFREIHVVLGWSDSLERLVPTGQ